MALPPFGVKSFELLAITVMVLAGIAGLALTLRGHEVALAATVLGQPFPFWFFASPGRVWLILQATLVIVGVAGGWMLQLFSLMMMGIFAGLLFVTPVGLLTTLPAICLLLLVWSRRWVFLEFRPRWQGEGDPPPGPWR